MKPPTLLLVLAALLSTTSAGQEIQYRQRIQLPLRDDAFRQPRAVVADLHANEIFVCDTFDHRIGIFDGQGYFEYLIPGGDRFRSPIDLAVDPEGYLLVLGFFGGRKSFTVLDFDGQLLETVELQDLPSEIDQVDLQSLALSPDGQRVFAVDEDNHRLWISDRQGLVTGWFDFEQGRSEEEIQDLILAHVDVYQDEVLVAAPSDGLVYRFGLDGKSRGYVGFKGTTPCKTAFPVAAALDAEGMILVLDKQRAVFTRWDPRDNRCLDEYMGFGDAPGALYQPGDIALDAVGRVYVAQGFQGRVQVYEGAVPAALPAGATPNTP